LLPVAAFETALQWGAVCFKWRETMNKSNIVSLNLVLAAVLFGVGAYWIVHTQQPLLVKIVIVIVAYFMALQWLYEYMPRTARILGKFTIILFLEIFMGLLKMGGRGR
jgi:uncharacterized membrane protein YesL